MSRVVVVTDGVQGPPGPGVIVRTTAEWEADDLVLARGRVGYDEDTGTLKVGDGSTAWSALPGISGEGSGGGGAGLPEYDASNDRHVLAVHLERTATDLPAVGTSTSVNISNETFTTLTQGLGPDYIDWSVPEATLPFPATLDAPSLPTWTFMDQPPDSEEPIPIMSYLFTFDLEVGSRVTGLTWNIDLPFMGVGGIVVIGPDGDVLNGLVGNPVAPTDEVAFAPPVVDGTNYTITAYFTEPVEIINGDEIRVGVYANSFIGTTEQYTVNSLELHSLSAQVSVDWATKGGITAVMAVAEPGLNANFGVDGWYVVEEEWFACAYLATIPLGAFLLYEHRDDDGTSIPKLYRHIGRGFFEYYPLSMTDMGLIVFCVTDLRLSIPQASHMGSHRMYSGAASSWIYGSIDGVNFRLYAQGGSAMLETALVDRSVPLRVQTYISEEHLISGGAVFSEDKSVITQETANPYIFSHGTVFLLVQWTGASQPVFYELAEDGLSATISSWMNLSSTYDGLVVHVASVVLGDPSSPNFGMPGWFQIQRTGADSDPANLVPIKDHSIDLSALESTEIFQAHFWCDFPNIDLDLNTASPSSFAPYWRTPGVGSKILFLNQANSNDNGLYSVQGDLTLTKDAVQPSHGDLIVVDFIGEHFRGSDIFIANVVESSRHFSRVGENSGSLIPVIRFLNYENEDCHVDGTVFSTQGWTPGPYQLVAIYARFDSTRNGLWWTGSDPTQPWRLYNRASGHSNGALRGTGGEQIEQAPEFYVVGGAYAGRRFKASYSWDGSQWDLPDPQVTFLDTTGNYGTYPVYHCIANFDYGTNNFKDRFPDFDPWTGLDCYYDDLDFTVGNRVFIDGSPKYAGIWRVWPYTNVEAIGASPYSLNPDLDSDLTLPEATVVGRSGDFYLNTYIEWYFDENSVETELGWVPMDRLTTPVSAVKIAKPRVTDHNSEDVLVRLRVTRTYDGAELGFADFEDPSQYGVEWDNTSLWVKIPLSDTTQPADNLRLEVIINSKQGEGVSVDRPTVTIESVKAIGTLVPWGFLGRVDSAVLQSQDMQRGVWKGGTDKWPYRHRTFWNRQGDGYYLANAYPGSWVDLTNFDSSSVYYAKDGDMIGCYHDSADINIALPMPAKIPTGEIKVTRHPGMPADYDIIVTMDNENEGIGFNGVTNSGPFIVDSSYSAVTFTASANNSHWYVTGERRNLTPAIIGAATDDHDHDEFNALPSLLFDYTFASPGTYINGVVGTTPVIDQEQILFVRFGQAFKKIRVEIHGRLKGYMQPDWPDPTWSPGDVGYYGPSKQLGVHINFERNNGWEWRIADYAPSFGGYGNLPVVADFQTDSAIYHSATPTDPGFQKVVFEIEGDIVTAPGVGGFDRTWFSAHLTSEPTNLPGYGTASLYHYPATYEAESGFIQVNGVGDLVFDPDPPQGISDIIVSVGDYYGGVLFEEGTKIKIYGYND